ncbi:hypothetical protein OO256_08480 [Pseudomonas sp. DCB_CB]|nr:MULTISPECIES: hypothetical protein [Pseudomonas]ANI34496.1 hypothetical protein AA098_13745 [Pseudomonas sp. JY-Q]EKT4565795.1 hypothetical protein [Pseudomonas putida]MCE0989223.1 hypothetical protein [Pseudomonas alloputida]MCX2690387.1 hypothetical protein [Pseudomonas sp. DCB_BZ]MCX2856139.1 hypothetical protein [Pseudomonas sp. DCB_CB]
MSTRIYKAGELDLEFGDEGYAKLPEPPNALHTPSSYAWTIDSAGRMIWTAGTAIDNKLFYYWTTLDAKGVWQPKPGFVEIEDSPIDPALSNEQKIYFLTPATAEGNSTFITCSQCNILENDDRLYYAAIGHFQNNFTPLDGFGTKGMIVVRPDGHPTSTTPPSTAIAHRRSEANCLSDASTPEQLQREDRGRAMAPATRSVLFGNTIKTLYASSLDSQPNQTVWLALHDAQTGVPVAGLGPDGSRSQWQIKNFFDSDSLFVPQGCHFFEDGGFALVGTEAGESIVARYKSNGQLDLDFNKVGFIRLSAHTIQLGADEDRIVIAVSTPLITEPVKLLLQVYDKHTGALDTTFNETGTLSIKIDLGMMIKGIGTQNVIIGQTGDIYIAGNLFYYDGPAMSDRGIVHRVTRDGKLDVSFGSGGRYVFPDKVTKLEEAQLRPDGLQFVALLDENAGYCAMKLLI